MDCSLFVGSCGRNLREILVWLLKHTVDVFYIWMWLFGLFVRVWPTKSSKNEPTQILIVLLYLILSKLCK